MRYVRTKLEPGEQQDFTVRTNLKTYYYLYAVATSSDYARIVLGYQK